MLLSTILILFCLSSPSRPISPPHPQTLTLTLTLRMPDPNPDERILTYGDSILLRSDLLLLRTPSFINDRLIHFYFTHLASTIKTPGLLLLPPSISFLLSQQPPEPPSLLPELAAPLSLRSRDLVLLTVNDNADPALAEGGAHWSLLVYDRSGGAFVHLDSCDGMNRRHARRLYDAVKGFVGGDPGFVAGGMPRQRNGYDCGVFVMAAARVVCDWFGNGEEGDGHWLGRLEVEAGEEKVARFRGEMVELIAGLGGRE